MMPQMVDLKNKANAPLVFRIQVELGDGVQPPDPQVVTEMPKAGYARFVAAVGLAELGEEEGVRWLIDHTRPNEFGLDGSVYHHSHFLVDSGSLRENCNAVLYDLSGLPGRGEESSPDWNKWWRENKESFTPRPVALKP